MRRLALVLVAVSRAASADPKDAVNLGGYLEVYGDWNFRDPDNGVNNLRGFDARHASFALQNAVLSVDWVKGPVTGRIAAQFGDAADNYYQAEPTEPPSGTAPASTALEWRHVQEAWAAWTPRTTKLELAAGLFTSPIGPEVVPTKDDWNWSRSNLFFMLPYFHAGVRAKHPIGGTHWTAIAAIYNGWNNAIDENKTPAVDAIAAYGNGAWSAQVQYFGGIQRADGSPEGEPWRHLFDAYVQGPIVSQLQFIAHVDAGFETTAFGTAKWQAEAVSLRFDVTRAVYVAARGDVFSEWRPAQARPMFLPYGVPWLSSATATVGWRPTAGLDLRAEYRHDHAGGQAFFGGHVASDAMGSAIANRKLQDTITGGVIAFF